ncbi:rhomboid family intramembrane serine protease [Staphylococcus pseudintermedius]|nr:rhomboid family intramembrane serine protease [Staphylococcus pseudintermedius]EIB5075167.1 rhomboid family intramembrane serine protease [Staphylococcus pseudintermedius]EJA1940706.1 rhomboid family intramembrane serine protease [Staphylococcus pseudintermedius]ELD8143638.1 rhomboid family intramembrane serine protease [Staphylococcus pseudintermedius]
MFEEKHLWQTSFLWMRYLNYDCVHYEKDKNEVWLAHKKRQHVVIFKQGPFTTQELDFDKDRIVEHQKQIAEFLGYDIKRYDVYVLTDKSFNTVNFNVHEPLQVQFHSIHNVKALRNTTTHPIIKRKLGQKDSKSLKEYQKRVLNQNIVEKAMYRFTPITYAVVAINVLIWLIVTWFTPHHTDYEIINLGALAHFNVVHGEWYRLITSMFLHIEFQHLLLNMLSLFIFGKLVEAFIGPLKMLGTYILSGIIGNLISLALITTSLSLGASGAIFGLMGALIALMIISRRFDQKVILQMVIAVVVMASLTLLIQNVNVVAHLGGLLGGVLVVYSGYFFNQNRLYFYILLGISIVILTLICIKIFMTSDTNIYNQIIQREMHDGQYTEAKDMIKQTYQNGYADDVTYYLSGIIIATQDSKAEAMAEWERGLKYFPNSPTLNFHMAIANRSLGDDKQAKSYIQKAIKACPNNQEYQNLKKELDD